MKYRVSSVEAFRQWELDDEAETDELIAKINGTFPSSQAMQAGTAFHTVLELSPTGLEVNEAQQDGFTFVFFQDMVIEVNPIRELRASKTYMVDGQPIVISGQVDSIAGKRIEDHKTTSRFDPERYLTGYQWRLYLDIFGADHFRWNVFELRELEEPMTYLVSDSHRLEQFRYPGLEADCFALVSRFARFVRDHVEAKAA